MPKVLRIAVVGAGTMAQSVHLPLLRRRWDRFSVEALVDHSPRRRREASEAWGIAEEVRYESVADLVAAVRKKTVSLDAVVLSTDGLHVEDVLAFIRRGIPVLVEPPVAFSAEELRSLADFERMAGRRLVVLAYPQQHDAAVATMAGHIARKDLRMIDYEVLMPASQPLFAHAHVTTSAYDLPSEVRSARRTALQEAVVAGTGGAATQRDRDLYVKGLLTGVAHQLAVVQKAYGPVTELVAVRHWPRGVIPGSIEILGELENGAPVRLVWHYLPFAPEYSERLRLISARRRVEVELAPPSFADRRSSVSLREKVSGDVTQTTVVSPVGPAEAMWDSFYAFLTKGDEPGSGIPEALAELALMHEILDRIVTADGRSLEPEEVEETEAAADGDAADADAAVVADAADADATVVVAEADADAAVLTGAADAEAGDETAATAADDAIDPAPTADEPQTDLAADEPAPAADEADTIENPVALDVPAGDQVTEALPDLALDAPAVPASTFPGSGTPSAPVDDVDAWNLDGDRADEGEGSAQPRA